jgi:hypothetical protein
MSDYSKIPTDKLRKLHYTVLKVYEKRLKEGREAGIKLNLRDILTLKSGFLKDIFKQADSIIDSTKDKIPEDILGLRYYIATINKIPLEAVRQIEINMQKEIKKRKEIIRQQLDAGNIEQLVKEVAK